MSPKHRQYEALRAFFVEGLPSEDVARRFGYHPVSFRNLCHQFRSDPAPQFFLVSKPGPRYQPKKTAAREVIVALRKQNHSIHEISAALKDQGIASLSPTAVGEVLKEEGFAPLPRRLDEERTGLRPTVEPVADVRSFSLDKPHAFSTSCGGLFLFIPLLARLDLDALARQVGLSGSQMIPAGHALRASLALKLWSLERKSHVMARVADQGLALFSGLNVTPKRSYLSEYSSTVVPAQVPRLLTGWYQLVAGESLFAADSFNLDFHSVPYYGEDPLVERHYVSMRSRSQPAILTFLAQDDGSQAFCYSNANLRKGEEADEILKFVAFWKRTHGKYPRHLVFDSRLTTHANLAILDDELKIGFITLRRRSPKLLAEIAGLPPSAWRRIELDVPTRKFRTPRVYETKTTIAGRTFRQIYIKDLGHDQPTILLTNEEMSLPSLITRYARRMLIENALSDAVRFFHMNALSSSIGFKADFDLALLVMASGLYRLLAREMRGYADAQARQLFRDIIETPADIVVTDAQVEVRFPRRAHLPFLLESGLLGKPVAVPWWQGKPLIMTS